MGKKETFQLFISACSVILTRDSGLRRSENPWLEKVVCKLLRKLFIENGN
jgi:hypothetical protein